MTGAPFASVDQLVDALEQLGDQPSDDVVPAAAHLLQTAQRLAPESERDPELVVAGLVHDLASALDLGVADHERAGAALVAPLLGERVARLVAGHVEAKRYLVAVDPAYSHGLSENSTFTLVGQGGAMTPAEVAAFEQLEDLDALVALRRADDAAKDPDAVVAPVAHWRPLLDQVSADSRG